jgi:hypothetical protein
MYRHCQGTDGKSSGQYDTTTSRLEIGTGISASTGDIHMSVRGAADQPLPVPDALLTGYRQGTGIYRRQIYAHGLFACHFCYDVTV